MSVSTLVPLGGDTPSFEPTPQDLARVTEARLIVVNGAGYEEFLERLLESAGGSVKLVEQMGGTKIPGYPNWLMATQLGIIPVIAIAMGPCAGLGAVKAACAHFSIMVKDTSQVFAGGPPPRHAPPTRASRRAAASPAGRRARAP